MIAKTEKGRFDDLPRPEGLGPVRAAKLSNDCPSPRPSPVLAILGLPQNISLTQSHFD